MTEIKRLEEIHLSEYKALTKKVLALIPNPDWFMGLSEELLNTMFSAESTLVAYGYFVDGVLAGTSLYDTCKEEFEEIAIASGADLTKKGAEIGVSMVLPRYRGQNIMHKLNVALIEAAKAAGFEYNITDSKGVSNQTAFFLVLAHLEYKNAPFTLMILVTYNYFVKRR